MPWLQSILREILGLFVDDGRFAAAILIWIVVAVLALHQLGRGTAWPGPVVFTGLAVILAVSVLRYSRRKQ